MLSKKVTQSGLEYYDNNILSSSVFILVGGLGDSMDGFYVDSMMQFGIKNNHRVLSVGLRSMPHYGLYTIDDDVQDINSFYTDLEIEGYEYVWFIGHSTGCQVLMLYSMRKKMKENETIVLQAPVSDREHAESKSVNVKEKIKVAQKLVEMMNENEGMILYLSHEEGIIRADRFISLFMEGGKEDFFSLGQSTKHLNPSNAKIFSILSTEDEYVVSPIDKIVEHLKSIAGMEDVYLVRSNHGFTGEHGSTGLSDFLQIISCIIAKSGYINK
ncbi:hypothetical protein NEMIN01_1187 [Nematocida minor]|uniref:uncharacterized protein n=1 Tax=Nematocida minor TaxID=1912983 RepID=UPI002220FC31|nr:uncharacterized protein NEMIN01_1187 [Nematocida minor]KAI5190722.1 hypothetical protein NEMIN01_1187 [Nematocida minor]